jgi:hypothetical protein
MAEQSVLPSTIDSFGFAENGTDTETSSVRYSIIIITVRYGS